MYAFRKRFAFLSLSIFSLALLTSAHAQTSAAVLPGKTELAKPSSQGALDPNKMQAADGAHVGITMHGHWVIDVKNPDGTIAEHRDFENSIVATGTQLLTALLAGYVVPSDYGILVSPQSGGTAPCIPAQSGYSGCITVRSLTTSPGQALCPFYYCATGLTYTTSLGANGSATSFTLAGSFTANQAGSIGNVATVYGTCPSYSNTLTTQATVTPANCSTTAGTGVSNVLSAATITTVNVVASQIVQVTVTITFS